MTLVRIAASLLGGGGVALMVGVGSVNTGWNKLPEAAMGFAAASLFGPSTVVAKKPPVRLPPAASVAWHRAFGTVPILVLALWEHPVWVNAADGGWVPIAYIST